MSTFDQRDQQVGVQVNIDTNRVSVYRMYPSGAMILIEVDPREVTVLDDVEEAERMLNQGYMVYVEQKALERAWGDEG